MWLFEGRESSSIHRGLASTSTLGLIIGGEFHCRGVGSEPWWSNWSVGGGTTVANGGPWGGWDSGLKKGLGFGAGPEIALSALVSEPNAAP